MTMLLTELLPPEHIVVPLEAVTFRDAVLQMLRQLERTGVVQDLGAVQKALASARGRDVVAVGDYVALPHFRTDAVEHLVLALGIANRPLDVSDTALAASPRVIALVLAPPEAATRYLQTVAALARLFRDESVAVRMSAARTPEEVLALPELSAARVQPDLLVRDVMSHRTEGVSPAASVRDGLDLMLKQGWRAAPVLGEKGEVIGLLTERDVMRALLPEIPRAGEPPQHARPRPTSAVQVRDAMTRSVLCVSEEMGLEEAANLMVNKNVEQVPVVHESVLTGMLTRSDIIRKLFGR
jgi:CBS domain-containing protein/mannitol/fructose-specific phosphotransferase system IIA component (Ntr-type)